LKGGKKIESGFVMFPSGHSRNTSANLRDILDHKNNLLGKLALSEAELSEKLALLNNIEAASNKDLQNIYNCKINYRKHSVDTAEFTD
jgi:2-methylcitrate dehydratase